MAALGLAIPFSPLLAQRVELEASRADRWLPADKAARAVTYGLTLQQSPRYVAYEEGRLVLVRDEGRNALPVLHTVVLFANGRGLLQHQTSGTDGRTEILWLDPEGRVRQRENTQLGFVPLVALSPDGHSLFAGTGRPPVDSALAGDERVAPPERRLLAFQPNGEPSWRHSVDPARQVVHLAISANGERSAVVTAERSDTLARHRLEVYGSRGERLGEMPLDTVAQRVVLVPGRPLLWLQTLRGHALFELADSGPLPRWRQSERRCAGSPGSAATDPGGRFLFLIDHDCRLEGPPRWRLGVLALDSGRVLQETALEEALQRSGVETEPRGIRPSRGDWITVSATEVSASAGEFHFAWQWKVSE